MLLELFIACNIRYVFLSFDSIKTKKKKKKKLRSVIKLKRFYIPHVNDS